MHDGNILNYLDPATTEEESSQYRKINFQVLVKDYIDRIRIFARKTVIQSVDEFKKNHKSFMIFLLTYVNNCLTDMDKDFSLTKLDLMATILGFLTTLTNKIALIPMFVDCGYAEKIIQCVRLNIFASHIDKLGYLIFIIIHNLSRDKMGLEKLQKEEAFNILMKQKQSVQSVSDKNNERLTLKFGAALISVATNDEPSAENKKLIVNTSGKLYGHCKQAADKDDLKSCRYHLSELLELLHRAFWNTYVIESILKNETNETETPVQFFSQLFLDFYGVLLDQEPDDLEKIAAEYLLKILLQISSYPEYQKELIENKQLCVVIESLAKREKLKLYDAQFIWCNLTPQTSLEKPTQEKSPMIYVSYDRADKEFCKEFVKNLRSKIAIPIWVDYEHVESSDDVWKYLTLKLKKIKSATVIMILVSTAYGDESTDKFRESSHIISPNILQDETKRLIVVNAEPNYNFNRSWMINLLRNKTVIPYDNNIGNMTNEVDKQIEVSTKSLEKRSFRPGKTVRKKTAISGDISANFRNRFIKFASAANSSSHPVNIAAQKEYLDAAAVSDTVPNYDSGVVIAQ